MSLDGVGVATGLLDLYKNSVGLMSVSEKMGICKTRGCFTNSLGAAAPGIRY